MAIRSPHRHCEELLATWQSRGFIRYIITRLLRKDFRPLAITITFFESVYLWRFKSKFFIKNVNKATKKATFDKVASISLWQKSDFSITFFLLMVRFRFVYTDKNITITHFNGESKGIIRI